MTEIFQYLHAMGVAHRDLKPSNIMLDESEPPILKLVDFGLAKMMNSKTLLRVRLMTRSDLLHVPDCPARHFVVHEHTGHPRSLTMISTYTMHSSTVGVSVSHCL